MLAYLPMMSGKGGVGAFLTINFSNLLEQYRLETGAAHPSAAEINIYRDASDERSIGRSAFVYIETRPLDVFRTYFIGRVEFGQQYDVQVGLTLLSGAPGIFYRSELSEMITARVPLATNLLCASFIKKRHRPF